ncbi:type VI secretion system protein TssA [Mesorhizobium sp. 128a]
MLNVDQLSRPVSDGNACGDAVDYDLSFLELEMASQSKPAEQIGSSVISEQPPDWREVWRLGLDLAARTKDLRIGVLLTRSALSQFGFSGLRQGLELLAAYVELYWPQLHPRPDPEDDGDQTVRLNALANLCDPSALLAEIRQVPLTASRQFGTFTLRDWVEAQRSRPGQTDAATIGLAFANTDPDQLDHASAELEASLVAATHLDTSVKKHVDSVGFDPLIALLRQNKDLVDLHRRAPHPTALPLTSVASADVPLPAEIRNRNDVIEMLGRISRWYQVNEPASPVPALVQRAKRLVSKDFMALLIELAPEGAAHYRSVAGLSADEGADTGCAR